MGQINTNNYPTVSSLADTDLLIVENATQGTGTTTPKQLRENAIGTDPLQTTAQTVTGAINEIFEMETDFVAGLGIGKKKTVTNNVIDTDIDLHRAPIVGDRLLIYFDEKVTNPTGLITYNNGTAVTSGLESVSPLYINAGLNILQYEDNLLNTGWVRKQNISIPNTLSGLSDTAIVSPSDGQLLTYDNESQKWKNKTYVEANMGFSDTELKKLKVGNVVYDTDGLRDYFVTDIENNNITISVLNSNQFVMENIAINTGAHSGSSSAWNLILDDGMYPVLVALKNADGTAFSDDIHENELLLVYVDTAGNVARVLDIPVDTTEIKTVSGNPITLTDAVAGNAIEVSAEIVASQDLHGYDKPWVGGAGINKLPLVLADIKSANTSGTWSDNVYTLNGGTFTVNTDSDGNVTGITANGTFSANSDFNLAPKGNYNALNGMALYAGVTCSTSTYTIYCAMRVSPWTAYAYLQNVSSVTISNVPNDSNTGFFIRVFAGGVSNVAFKPMVATAGITGFYPYTNVCPITGFSSVVISDVDAESQTATVTVSLGSTVYGGTLNLTTGELTVTHANIASYNGESIGEPWISSMDEYTQGGTPTTGAQVVYTLATPTTATLTAAQLALVKGYNQLSCNSGDMEITYKASGLDALKERVDELEDRVDDLTVSDLTDTDITSPTNGQVLGYNSTSGKWENQNPSGGGTTLVKTRYSVTYSSWSSVVNSDGYYTYSLSLNPTINISLSPDVLIAGSSNITQPTDTEKTMFGYVERCYLSSSTLTLYAKTKPTSTFYIYVEGVAGSGSGGIVGSVIKPNGESSGGGEVYSDAETLIGTWYGMPLYRKVIDLGELPNATSKSVATGLGNNAKVRIISGIAFPKVFGGEVYSLPYVSTSSLSNNITFSYSESSKNITVITGADCSGYYGMVILEYFKS